MTYLAFLLTAFITVSLFVCYVFSGRGRSCLLIISCNLCFLVTHDHLSSVFDFFDIHSVKHYRFFFFCFPLIHLLWVSVRFHRLARFKLSLKFQPFFFSDCKSQVTSSPFSRSETTTSPLLVHVSSSDPPPSPTLQFEIFSLGFSLRDPWDIVNPWLKNWEVFWFALGYKLWGWGKSSSRYRCNSVLCT